MAYKRTQFGLFLEKILAMDPDVLRAEYFRPDEGMRIYHMGRTPIMQLAEEAGALYKINRHVLINKKAFDENFQKYRVKKGAPSYEKGKYKSVESNQSIS